MKIKKLFLTGTMVLAVIALPTAKAAVCHALAEGKKADPKIFSAMGYCFQKLQVDIAPLKPSFKVNEPIGFSLSSNREVFIYLFSMDHERRKATMILPNRHQSSNKYPATRGYRIPNNTVEFLSDQPGTEKLVMVASEKWIDWDKQGYKEAGDFMEAPADLVEKQIKALKLRPIEIKRRSEDVAVQGSRSSGQGVQVTRLTVTIGEASAAPTDTSFVLPVPDQPILDVTDLPIAFVSTDRQVYAPEGRVRLLFGADQSGYVHLYSVDPEGEIAVLTTEKVSGSDFYKLEAKVGAQTGQHAVVAAFSQQRKASVEIERLLRRVLKQTDTNNKALSLVTIETQPMVIHNFEVSLTR